MMKVHLFHFDTIDSTQLFARNHLQTLDPQALSVFFAAEQTAGLGRSGAWISSRGNLFATFCFQVPENSLQLPLIPLFFWYAVGQLIDEMGLKISFKWPNDLFYKEKKLGGILGETHVTENATWVVMGVGVNLNLAKAGCQQIDQPATSLKIELSQEVDVESFQNRLVDKVKMVLSWHNN